MDFLLNFDIFSLNETFVDFERTYTSFVDYDVYLSKATRLTQRARKSGGVLVFVRKYLQTFVRRLDVKYNNVVVLELDKTLFGLCKHVLLICTYVHPYESKYWDIVDFGHGMEILEQCIVDLYEKCGDFFLVICGDLNARTGCQNAEVFESYEDEWIFQKDSVNEDMFVRSSQDKETNAFGKELLDMCAMFDLIILNGIRLLGYDDSLTFLSSVGGSTIDYFIASSELCCKSDFVHLFQIASLTDSPHFPISLSLCTQTNLSYEKTKEKAKWIEKIIWDQSLDNGFIDAWNSNVLRELCEEAFVVMDDDVNEALRLFTNALLRASDCMKKRVLLGGGQREMLWFDRMCSQAKTKARRLLSTFRQSKKVEDRIAYVKARKDYKELIKNKKARFRREKARHLASLENNGKIFWKEIKKLSGNKRVKVSQKINDTEWFDYFKGLFNIDEVSVDWNAGVEGQGEAGEGTDLCEELNAVITEEEVKEAVRRLKKGKACGTDGVLAEMLKLVDSSALRFLTKLFNVLFDRGVYPDEWSKAIIVPIYKKGDADQTDNYRGVSLLSLLSKCYTAVLNKRLVNWVEKYDKLTESQAGFRRGYSTSDHIFTLNAIVEKCFAKKGVKLYACFVDLRKAFDSVQRQPLFEVLLKSGMNGKFVKAVVSIYKTVMSCVRLDSDRLTDFFECPVGLRQGCMLSPEIFSLLINEIALAVDSGGVHGIQLLPGLVELYLLLFADDIVLLSDTARGLQNQINIMDNACKNLYLNVNIEKTKVMVFRKGGFLGKNERWWLGGKQLEVVSEYNYLGFVFTTRMSIKRGVDALAVKGRRACIDCIRHMSRLPDISKSSFFKIFDTQVQPVLLYASEVWGLHRLENVEKVHTLACKRYLNVQLRVPNKFVYGETGRYPLFMNSAVRCIRYWLKLLTMDRSRLPRQAYEMLKNLDERGKMCWATRVKNILLSMGFGYAWIHQGVGCEKTFVSLFRQRIKDVFIQEWHSAIASRDIYQNYRLFKFDFECEKYFEFLEIKCFRDCLVKLRLGTLPIGASHFRRTYRNDVNKMCNVCNVEEDEDHFIFHCPLYIKLRQKYINDKYQTYINLLRNGSVLDKRRLSTYIFLALKTHEDVIPF